MDGGSSQHDAVGSAHNHELRSRCSAVPRLGGVDMETTPAPCVTGSSHAPGGGQNSPPRHTARKCLSRQELRHCQHRACPSTELRSGEAGASTVPQVVGFRPAGFPWKRHRVAPLATDRLPAERFLGNRTRLRAPQERLARFWLEGAGARRMVARDGTQIPRTGSWPEERNR